MDTSTATLMMDEPEQFTRRFAMPHNPAALRALATRIQEHADKVLAAADLLESQAPGKFVALNHLKAVEAGLIAIRSVVHEVEMKVDTKKFHKITIEPVEPVPPAKRKKRP
jgi:hypothetical protein